MLLLCFLFSEENGSATLRSLLTLIFAEAVLILLDAALIFAEAVPILLDAVIIFAEAVLILLDAGTCPAQFY